MNQEAVKVSVIIPCYNLGKYLNEAVESVLSQTYQDFEIIIVNDGSTDEGTLNLFKDYNPSKTQVIHTENQGVASARNTAINASKGIYILPLDADDKIASTYLEKAVAALDQNENIGIVYCEAELFGEAQGKWALPEYNFPKILLGNMIFCTGLFRKSDWAQVKGYNLNMVYGREDHDFWLSIIELGKDVYRIPEVLFYYRQRPDSRDRSMEREHLIHSYSQLFKNHPQLYSNNIEVVFEQIVDLNALAFYYQEKLQALQIESTLRSLNLREINLMIFPDWKQPEEALFLEVERVVRTINLHPDKSYMTLLIDISSIPDEVEFDAHLFLSSIIMNLVMEEDLDINKGSEISLVGKLSQAEWEALLPRLHCRIIFNRENQPAIAEVGADNLPNCKIDNLGDRRAVKLESGTWVLR